MQIRKKKPVKKVITIERVVIALLLTFFAYTNYNANEKSLDLTEEINAMKNDNAVSGSSKVNVPSTTVGSADVSGASSNTNQDQSAEKSAIRGGGKNEAASSTSGETEKVPAQPVKPDPPAEPKKQEEKKKKKEQKVVKGTPKPTEFRKLSYEEMTFTSKDCSTFVAPPDNTEFELNTVKIDFSGKTFHMIVYKNRDIVGRAITEEGLWDYPLLVKLERYLKVHSKAQNIPLKDLSFVDIGAHVGWFTFYMASMGVKVISFEPYAENNILIKQSMCLPENLESGVSERITLHSHGLGVNEETCFIYSSNSNVGDGHIKCVEDESELELPDKYSVRGKVPVRPLDLAYHAGWMNVFIAKMDTEGYEANVLEGGIEFFLESGVDIILTEFVPKWVKEKGNNKPEDFMKTFYDAGFRALRPKTSHLMHKDEMMNMDNFGEGKEVTLYSPFYRRANKFS